jgi:dynein heavy chain
MARFEETAKNSLHLVLAMSYIGEAFKTRLRQFPALVNCCTIDWFLPWPTEALDSVARHFFKDVEDLPMLDGIVQICVDMQERVISLTQRYKDEVRRYYYITPTSYLILIKTFQTVLKDKRKKINSDINKFDRGLKQLAGASTQVEGLKAELTVLIPQLKIKAEESAKAQKIIEVQNVEVSKIQNECQVETDKANGEKAKADEIETDCKAALAEVQPIALQAAAAVDKLKPSDVTELCGFKAATPPVALVAQSLCYFFNSNPIKIRAERKGEADTFDYWTPCKKAILNAKLLPSLKNFPRDQVNQELADKCNVLFAEPMYEKKALENASKAAGGIGTWCKAIIKYFEAMKIVKPKEEQLKVAKETSAVAEASRAAAQEKLDEVNARLKALVDDLEAKRKDEQNLRNDKDNKETKLKLADLLMTSLKAERESWDKLLI